MPWTETSVMDGRLSFVVACRSGDGSFTALCERHGISRKTGYKWLSRYDADGAAGLHDRSRSRLTHEAAIDAETVATVLALRAARPSWGPRKLLARLAMDDPDRMWPAASTVGDLLRREGLSRRRRTRGRRAAPRGKLTEATTANEVWAADFKGWFRTGDGLRCEPLTVTDSYSRLILTCRAVPRVTVADVQPILTDLFRAHGLPRVLRTDNGSPFANRSGLGGLTQLSVWLLKLGVRPQCILPGRPDQNGRHERMHRTLAEETACPPAPTWAAQQARMDAWRRDYNTSRPHEGIGQRTPASLWQPSPRRLPARIDEWDYPADHHRRRVTGKGYILWRDKPLYLTEALREETVALARRDDGDWTVRFRDVDLAVVDKQSNVIRRAAAAEHARHTPASPGNLDFGR